MGSEVIKIAYICDGLDKCSDKVGCYRCGKPGFCECCHTFNPEHARYGAVENPEDYPNRFKLLDIDELCWWEGDVLIP